MQVIWTAANNTKKACVDSAKINNLSRIFKPTFGIQHQIKYVDLFATSLRIWDGALTFIISDVGNEFSDH